MCRPPHSSTATSLPSTSLMVDGFAMVTPGPSLMSVPRPAMFVAIVTASGWPASAMISASRWWYFALSTLCVSPARWKRRASVSDASTLVVPTSTGKPSPCSRFVSSTIALYFSRRVL